MQCMSFGKGEGVLAVLLFHLDVIALVLGVAGGIFLGGVGMGCTETEEPRQVS